jgi:hypothetical protein
MIRKPGFGPPPNVPEVMAAGARIDERCVRSLSTTSTEISASHPNSWARGDHPCSTITLISTMSSACLVKRGGHADLNASSALRALSMGSLLVRSLGSMDSSWVWAAPCPWPCGSGVAFRDDRLLGAWVSIGFKKLRTISTTQRQALRRSAALRAYSLGAAASHSRGWSTLRRRSWSTVRGRLTKIEALIRYKDALSLSQPLQFPLMRHLLT